MTSRGDRPTKICVIGAGVIGLSTAVQLLESVQSSTTSVTLIADSFDVDTTSDGAAGIFRPTGDHAPGVPRHLLKCVWFASVVHVVFAEITSRLLYIIAVRLFFNQKSLRCIEKQIAN
jgi:glycine/D-amino acid oxidase-like deaminating enzyme